MLYSDVVLADSPKMFLLLGEPSGILNDSSGHGHSAVAVGGVTYAASGPVAGAGAVTLDGSTGYLSVADHADLDFGDVFSLECWVQTAFYSATQNLFDKGTNGYAFRLGSYSPHLRLDLLKENVALVCTTGQSHPEDGGWHHCVATKNGATPIRLYVDAVDVSGTTNNATIANTASALILGSTGAAAFLNGSIALPAAYATALSQARVSAHFQAAQAITILPRKGWRFVLADASGFSLGELAATGRGLTAAISQTRTATCTIRSDDKLWPSVAAGDSMLKVYGSGGDLELYGPLVADEEQASGVGTHVALTAADQSWELGHRFVGKDTAGVGDVYTTQDSGQIAFALLTSVNSDQVTGIEPGVADTFIDRTITFLWKRMLDALNEMGAIDGSYEWQLRYADDPTGGPPAVFLDLYASVGSDRSASVFLEYGTGKTNCSAYDRARTIDTQATRVWALGSGSAITASAYDATYELHYRREDVLSFGDLTDATLLDALATAHVAVRSKPRVIVTLTPFPKTAPRFGVDYQLGDLLTAHVLVEGVERVNGSVRVWGVDIAIDELGNEAPTLNLVPS